MQPSLALKPHRSQTFDNFIVTSQNERLVSLLKQAELPSLLYLWGDTGCSHLLNAFALLRENMWQRYDQKPSNIAPVKPLVWLLEDGYHKGAIHCLPHAERIPESFYPTLLRVLENLKKDDSIIVMTAPTVPEKLPFSEALKTRINAGVIFKLYPLNDEESWQALQQYAKERGLTLSDTVLKYCFTYMARDLSTLLTLLDDLDSYSIALRRDLTVPLIKQWLDNEKGIKAL